MIIYTVCLVVGLAFTIISAIAGHFFGGHDGDAIGTGGHAEAGLDSSGLPGISFFSPTVLATFVTAFGALGLAFEQVEATRSVWVSAPLAAVGGGLVALLVFWLFNSMFHRTQSSSESHVASLVGHDATVVTPIPADGVGEIAYVQGGTRYTAPARSTSTEVIVSGCPVRIARIVGTQFYVEPM